MVRKNEIKEFIGQMIILGFGFLFSLGCIIILLIAGFLVVGGMGFAFGYPNEHEIFQESDRPIAFEQIWKGWLFSIKAVIILAWWLVLLIVLCFIVGSILALIIKFYSYLKGFKVEVYREKQKWN